MRNVTFSSPDILYFNPKLIEQSFFKNKTNITMITGLISGSTNNLIGKNLIVKTGANSLIETDFNIKGLPEYETAFFDFPNLKIHTGRKDMKLIVGSSIPENIELPENISSQLSFKGQMKSFKSIANITSSFGDANLSVAVDRNENFRGKVKLSNFDMGSLLRDTIMYGPLSLTAEAKVQGSKIKTINAKIKVEPTQFYFNKDDLCISFIASADLKGKSVNEMKGTAGITNMIVASNGKKYVFDNFLSASINDSTENKRNINSALIGINYSGTVSPTDLPSILSQFVNNYFPISDSKEDS